MRPRVQPARRGAAWRVRPLAAGLLALPILNAASTGDHLLRTLARGDWAVAGSDLVFLTLGGAAALAAHALSPERKPVTAQRAAQASG